MDNQKKKLQGVRYDVERKLEYNYPNVKIFFTGEKSVDSRMNYFESGKPPLYIPMVNPIDGDENMKKYAEEIYNQDRSIKGKFGSEIAVPLLYKMMIPFGYIQINHSKPLSQDDFSEMRKAGIATSELISRDNSIIKMSMDVLHVGDFSASGLSIFFKNKMHIKHFKEKSLVYFNLVMPDKKTAAMLCRVSNINVLNNIYRIGVEVENMDAIGEVNYSEFVEKQNTK